MQKFVLHLGNLVLCKGCQFNDGFLQKSSSHTYIHTCPTRDVLLSLEGFLLKNSTRTVNVRSGAVRMIPLFKYIQRNILLRPPIYFRIYWYISMHWHEKKRALSPNLRAKFIIHLGINLKAKYLIRVFQ